MRLGRCWSLQARSKVGTHLGGRRSGVSARELKEKGGQGQWGTWRKTHRRVSFFVQRDKNAKSAVVWWRHRVVEHELNLSRSHTLSDRRLVKASGHRFVIAFLSAARRRTSSWVICGRWLPTRSCEKVSLRVRHGATTGCVARSTCCI